MLRINSEKNFLWAVFVAVLIIVGSIPVMGAGLPASKTEEQQILEEKETPGANGNWRRVCPLSRESSH